MNELLSSLPLGFWISVIILVAGMVWAAYRIQEGIGLPTLAVLGTVAAWYFGDAFYNDYTTNHIETFTSSVLKAAWWQVAWFLLAFVFLVKPIHDLVNRPHLAKGSMIYRIATTGHIPTSVQTQIQPLFICAVSVYGVLSFWAAFRLGPEIFYYYFPYLDHKAEPWGRDRIGTGIDFLLGLAGYLQIFAFSIFGLAAALSNNARIRGWAVLACLLSWPYYFFDRTRNSMLLVALPGVLAWVFLRLRARFVIKLAVALVFFLAVDTWFRFVIENRSEMSISEAFKEKKVSEKSDVEVKHGGLEMFQELCWINTFLAEGAITPSLGFDYFTDIVNPVPRILWKNKPMIGIDYAIARGMGGGEKSGAGVMASVSTGMIGQGILNFGQIIGPAFVALLMSYWVALLARLDLQGVQLGRIPLYILGLIMTFNLGRNISWLTLYPFAFGIFLANWMERRANSQSSRLTKVGRAPQKPFSSRHENS